MSAPTLTPFFGEKVYLSSYFQITVYGSGKGMEAGVTLSFVVEAPPLFWGLGSSQFEKTKLRPNLKTTLYETVSHVTWASIDPTV